MWIRFVTICLWLGVGASAVSWLMPWWRPQESQAPATVVAMDASIPPADWSPLLLRTPAGPAPVVAPPDASRFRLVGVAGPLQSSRQGVALLSIDGKPPRAFRPGEVVEGQRVVLEVTAHTVKIGLPGGTASVTLQAPLLPPPATGVPAGLAAPQPS